MPTRNPSLAANITLSDGSGLFASTSARGAPRVAAGYYLSSNADPSADLQGVRWTSQTRYAGFSQPGGAQLPPTGWVPAFLARGGWLNLVLELKSYAAGNAAVPAQSFAVEGKTYTVPAMAGTMQRKTTPVPCWSYEQVWSGACDGLLHRSLAALRTAPYGSRINVQLASEVDTDNQFGVTYDGQLLDWPTADAGAVRAYRYIMEWMRDPPNGIAPLSGVSRTFSMGYAGSWSGREAFLRTHPESLPVDYMMWNCYNHGSDAAPATRLRETLAYRDAAGPKMRALDIIVAEFGSSSAWSGGQASYLSRWPAAVNTVNAEQALKGQGGYVMTNWFGSNDETWGKVPTADKPAFFAAMRTAYSASPFLP